MNLVNINKKELKQFEERKASDLSNVFSYRGYEYITVHPMSNETKLLAKIGLQPTDCKSVDLYWRIENQIFFLQVFSLEFSENRRTGLFARWNSINPMVYLAAYLKTPFISKEIIETVMDAFLEKNLLSENFSQDSSFKNYVYLSDSPNIG